MKLRRERGLLPRQIVLSLLISLIFLGGIFPSMVLAQATVGISADAPRALDKVLAVNELNVREVITHTVLGALMNGVSYFTRKIAYDAAKYIADGAYGKNSLVYQDKGAGDYLVGVAGDTVGNMVGELGSPLGLDLCRLPDLDLQIFLQISIRDIFGTGEPKSNCSWQDLTNNWSAEGFANKYGPELAKRAPEKFAQNISVKNSDFGIAFSALAKIDKFTAGAVEGKKVDRIIGQGYKEVKDLISGYTVTPAAEVQKAAEIDTAQVQMHLSTEQIAGLYGEATLKNLPAIASTFLSTLASTLLQNALTKGAYPINPSTYNQNFFGAGGFQDREQANKALNDLFAPPASDVREFDVISEFSVCDDTNPDSNGLNNCVIDEKFAQALHQADAAGSKPLTLQQAVEAKFLNKDWQLISPRRPVDNTDIRCRTRAFCYSNIQKLRRARILPLGFEIAALKANPDSNSAWTLGQVMAGFDQCAPDGNPSVQYPFCHLINPNWVLKAPKARAEMTVNGPELKTAKAPERRQEHVDISTCVVDENGKCSGIYGYCTKEKNIWNLGGDSCPAQYNTCQTYTNTDNQAQASYLSRTVDYGQCTVATVGCRAYSLEELAPTVPALRDPWLASVNVDINRKRNVWGQNQVLFANKNITTAVCTAKDDGCSALYGATIASATGEFVRTTTSVAYLPGTFVEDPTRTLYLKKAPDYLKCYDANPATPAVEWPQTRSQVLNDLTTDSRCDVFASACTSAEVGCDSFTKTKEPDAPHIPAIVGAGNRCDLRCEGYSTYRQEQTFFEPTKFPLYFIPTNGQSCSAQSSGCDEFTNIDAAARGGESLEYYSYLRRCERPDGQNQKTYYAWQGSATQGYVLAVHRLLQMNQTQLAYISSIQGINFESETVAAVLPVGSPAYSLDEKDSLNQFYQNCNKDSYGLILDTPTQRAASPDCRALYDDQGNIFYRLLSETVTVSDSCHILRKTVAYLHDDPTLTTLGEAACNTKKGFWTTSATGANVCQRCNSGGLYEQNACVYWTITDGAQSTSCPKAANGCRRYIGNAGYNQNTAVLNTSFEPVDPASSTALLLAKIGWLPVASTQISAEAVQVGQHSLQVNGVTQFTYTFATNTLKTYGTYELSFWARGGAQSVDIFFTQGPLTTGRFTYNPLTKTPSLAGIGNDWQRYQFGPVEFTGDPNLPTQLVFVRSGAATPLFLDVVRMVWRQDDVFLIKNSWQTTGGADVPAYCDAKPTDGYPGEALGCTAYADSKNRAVYATGFQSLCREKAVGCEPVFDTHNTLDTSTDLTSEAKQAQMFNVWCRAAADTNCSIVVAGRTFGPCRVPQNGADGCYVAGPVIIPSTPPSTLPANATIVTSTVIIPADTPSTTPIFLTNRPEVQCAAAQLGCQKLATETQVFPQRTTASYSHDATYLRNDPALYVGTQGGSGTLCQAEVVGCSQYTSTQGTHQVTSYFKDPALIGNALCGYSSIIPAGSTVTRNGWFLQGIGQCSGGTRQYCHSTSECAPGNTCDNSGGIACYPNYIQRTTDGVVYDLWSNDSQNYAGYVGVCDAAASGCRQLLDPADTSNNYPKGKPYYTIFNSKIEDKIGQCAGQVSLTHDCVLFNKTDEPKKVYSTTLTYRASDQTNPKYGLVTPIADPVLDNNDANIILKVDRDRTCSEWLACRSSFPVLTDSGRTKNLCYDYRACSAAKVGGQSGGTCTNWLPETDLSGGPLTEDKYIDRGTSWYSPEYTGYTLYNKFQINDLKAYTFTDERNPALFKDKSYFLYDEKGAVRDCEADDSSTKNWQACGNDRGGRCYNAHCLYPSEGRFPPEVPSTNIPLLLTYIESASCKGYPEVDSPFPTSTVLKSSLENGASKLPGSGAANQSYRFSYKELKPGFDAANVCQDGNCSCEYKKQIYGGKTDYWTYYGTSPSNIPSGICNGGLNEGKPCTITASTDSCTIDGSTTNPSTCQLKTKVETQIGLRGYCLERDYSHPINGKPEFGEKQEYACLTWLPIGVSASNIDIYNTSIRAGYFPEPESGSDSENGSGRLYCAAIDKGGLVDNSKFPSGYAFAPDDLHLIYESVFTNRYFVQNISHFCEGRFSYNFSSNPSDVTRLTDKPPRRPSRVVDDAFVSYRFYPYVMCTQYPDSNTPNQQDRNNQLTLIYQMMQTWAWENIGSNAVVMRAEATTIPTYAFVPRTDIVPSPNGRTIPEEAYSSTNVYSSPFAEFGNASSTINEKNLDSVYFIPTKWWGNVRGITPRLLQKDIVLPISDLENMVVNPSVGRSKLTSIPAIFIPDAITGNTNPNIDFAVRDPGDSGEFIYDVFPDDQAGVNVLPEVKRDWVWTWAYRMDRDASHTRFFDAGVERRYVITYFVRSVGTASNGAIPLVGSAENPFNFLVSQPEFINQNRAVQSGVPIASLAVPDDGRAEADPLFGDPSCPQHQGDFQNSGPQNYFAIELDFDANGNFLRYKSRWCNAFHDFSGTQSFDFTTIASLTNQCTLFDHVYQSTGNALQETTNKAWTNRVWGDARGIDGLVERRLSTYDGSRAEGVIARDTSNAPYGSTNLTTEINTVISPAQQSQLLIFAFRPLNNTTINGVPYSCTDNVYSPMAIQVNIAQLLQPPCSLGSLYTRLSGQPPEKNLVNVLSRSTIDTGQDAIKSIFAQAFHILRLTPNRATYILSSRFNNQTGVNGYDISGDASLSNDNGDLLVPPQIYSLNPATCVVGSGVDPTRQQTICTAGEANNMTVSGEGGKGKNGTRANYNQDGAPNDEDLNGDGYPDAIINVGTQTANLSFFAFADDDRMPIRRVLIDWGDGSTISNKRGLYKNRKPFCASDNSSALTVGICGRQTTNPAQTLLTGITCRVTTDCPTDESGQFTYTCYGREETTVDANGQAVLLRRVAPGNAYNSNKFGNTIRACQNTPFIYQHDYSCTQYDVAHAATTPYVVRVDSLQLVNPDAYRQLTGAYGLRNTDSVCIFRPRVQAIDNWGWCNGVNADGTPKAEGYFNDGMGRICDSYQESDNVWTRYKGLIVVVPPSA